MKKIWIINQYAVPNEISKRQLKMSKFLTEHGYDVTIVCGSKVHGTDKNLIQDDRKYIQTEFDGAHFIVVKSMDYAGNGIKRILASIKFERDVMKMAKKMPKPDIVISDFVGLFGNAFLKFKTKYGAKFITDVLDLWPESFVDMGYIGRNNPITKVLYAMEHKAYRLADYCIFSFEGGKDYIVEKGWDKDVDLSKVKYLNNGIDLEEVLRQREEYVYEDADLDSDKLKAVYLGSIRQANNVQAIVDGAEALKIRGIEDVDILVYGDGDKREELEKQCAEKGLTNIKFKGRLDIKYAPNVLNRGDLCLFNFEDAPLLRFGCSPNKLFMYFAAEKPVLSTVRPNYDLVEGRECGIVVNNDGESIADGLERIKNLSKEEYEQCCRNSGLVAKEFDYKQLVESVLIKLL